MNKDEIQNHRLFALEHTHQDGRSHYLLDMQAFQLPDGSWFAQVPMEIIWPDFDAPLVAKAFQEMVNTPDLHEIQVQGYFGYAIKERLEEPTVFLISRRRHDEEAYDPIARAEIRTIAEEDAEQLVIFPVKELKVPGGVMDEIGQGIKNIAKSISVERFEINHPFYDHRYLVERQ